jgi:centrosomal protein CEP164
MLESIIIEEEIDDNYEPSQEEIVEYASWLGMHPLEDRDLFILPRRA